MPLWLLVGVGGFIGAISRYYISGWIQNGIVSFPLGTLGVNFLGSFLLSVVLYLAEYKGIFTEQQRVFLSIGILGAFTTMSTFSYESFRLLEQKEHFYFALNVIGTVVLTILAVYAGRALVLNVWNN